MADQKKNAGALECGAASPEAGGEGRTVAYRREYLARIHRAQDFIERHLAEPILLEEVARAANFSVFHFHRLYSALTGEPLYQYIQRVRLERAASSLRTRPGASITSIALDHGFGSPATFARAFKAYFGISACQFRRDGGAQNSKIGKALGKIGKEPSGDSPYASSVDFDLTMKRGVAMEKAEKKVCARSIDVRDLPAKTLAYVRHVGPYAGDAALFGRLWEELSRWALPRGLFQPPQTEIMTVYHDDPEITREDQLRISFGITVPEKTAVCGTVGVMELPAGKYVCASFEIDVKEYGDAWKAVCSDWLPQSGWQPGDGPCYEVYLNDPAAHPEHKHLIEIRMSVVPLMA